jgi:PKD repeat protein
MKSVAALLGVLAGGPAAAHGPLAEFTVAPASGPPPLSVAVDASASISAHGAIISYDWDWGDGSPGDTGVTAAHVYAATGTYTILLSVKDQGGSGSKTARIDCLTAGNAVPAAQITGTVPAAGNAPLLVAFTGVGTDAAPAGDVLEHRWVFGDGSAPVLFPGLASGQASSPSHAYASSGTFLCTLQVSDAEGILATATTTVVVTQAGAPFASFSLSPASGPPLLVVSVDGSASFDSDGSILSWFWAWGDGTATLTSGPLSSHAYGATGTYTVTLTVTDNGGLTGSASQDAVCISVGNTPPTSHIQSAVPPSGPAPLSVTFLGHGHDNAGPLELRWDFGDGSPFQTLAGVPPHANVTASHEYVHPGTYTCTLRVKDPENVTALRSIAVTVGNPEPAITRDACGFGGLEVLLLAALGAFRRRARR